MSWRRGTTPGWAAFDIKQQKKQGLILEVEHDIFPPISSARPSQNVVKDGGFSTRSFSSVLLPSVNPPRFTPGKKLGKPLHVGNSRVDRLNSRLNENNTADIDVVQACEKFQALYLWADRGLIEDVMAAVDNDSVKASTLLKSMVPSDRTAKNEDKNMPELNYGTEELVMNNGSQLMNGCTSLKESTSLAGLSSVLDDSIEFMNIEFTDCLDNTSRMNLFLDKFGSVPVEPDWEEDDIYLIYRREAIKMMRLASKHCGAASDAYLRGEHPSAQLFAQKAREEWMAAEKLNVKAAKDILRIRNCDNNQWKLDLHGLHATEAVNALQEHLQKIESQAPSSNSASTDKLILKARGASAASNQTLNYMHLDTLDKQMISHSPRSCSLEVITGRGNHSRGHATLPTAIRNFLDENRYHYDEPRPGVITVRPKFRRR